MTTPYDLGSVFDQHVAAEFQDKSVDATMDTMVEEPYVWHVPVLTGGAGREAVQGVWYRGPRRCDAPDRPRRACVGAGRLRAPDTSFRYR